MVNDIGTFHKEGKVPAFSSFIAIWRERKCNRWDEISSWSDVLTWRAHMYTLLANTFSAPELANNPNFAKVHDIPWTAISLAKVARKQNLTTTCLTALSKTYGLPQTHPNDAFHRVREQVHTS